MIYVLPHLCRCFISSKALQQSYFWPLPGYHLAMKGSRRTIVWGEIAKRRQFIPLNKWINRFLASFWRITWQWRGLEGQKSTGEKPWIWKIYKSFFLRPVILQRNENPRLTSPIHLVSIDIVNGIHKKTAYFVGGNSLETRFGISKQLFCLWWNPLGKQNSS